MRKHVRKKDDLQTEIREAARCGRKAFEEAYPKEDLVQEGSGSQKELEQNHDA